MTIVGVLALQGDFSEHVATFRRIGVESREVRLPDDLDQVDALIIPGGESTTICRLMDTFGLVDPIKRFAAEHAVWGTCAGAIVMARSASDLDRPTLDLMDIAVRRNAFGAQVDSFETDLDVDGLVGGPFPAVFIRAPLIESVGEGVQPLATLPNDGIVAARQGHLMVTAFHPELTGDSRLHRYFLSIAEDVRTELSDE